MIQKFQFFFYGKIAEFRDRQSADRNCSGNVRQTFTAAMTAGRCRHTFLQFLPHRVGLRLSDTALDIGNDAFECLFQRTASVSTLIVQVQLLTARAIEDHLHGLLRKLPDGHMKIKMIFQSKRLKIHSGNGVILDIAPAAGLNPAVENRNGRIGNDQRRVYLQTEAQAGALRTGTHGIIERKQTR